MPAARRPKHRMRSRARARVSTFVVGALALALVGPASIVSGMGTDAANAAPGDSFAADSPTVFISQQQPTVLYKSLQGQGNSQHVRQTPIPNPSNIVYNAIAYREADDYIYGMRNAGSGSGNRHLLRIGQSGAITDLGLLDLPAMREDIAWNAGTFGEGAYADTYFLRPAWNEVGTVPNSYMSNLYAVEFSGTGAALTTVTRTIPLVSELGNSVVVRNTSDLFFFEGYVWGYIGSQNGVTRTLFRIDPSTGVTHGFPVPSGVVVGNTFGAQWVYGNGNIGLADNATGRITQLRIVNPTSASPGFEVAARLTGPASSLNDGTSKQGGLADLSIVKTVSSGQVLAGSSFTYTLTVTNTSTTEWSSGFVAEDLVPDGLTTVSTSTPGCEVVPQPTGTQVTCSGGVLAPGASSTIVIVATLPIGTTGCITNTGTVLGNESDPNLDNNVGSVDVCAAEPGLTVTKTSDAVETTRQGDVVRYTVTATNTGSAPYTAAKPALITDDLTGVLDDAVYNADAALAGAPGGTLGYTEPRITWTGPLAVGASVSFSYTVTLGNAGDGVVRNVAFEGGGTTPVCDPPVDGVDPDTGVPCAETELLLPRLTVTKTADLTELPTTPGTIEYTVTVTNAGPGDITAALPIDVLDTLDGPGATLTSATAPVGTTDIDGDEFTWTGALAAQQSVVITAVVSYTPPAADPDDPTIGIVLNTACIVQTHLVLLGAEPCASVELRTHDHAQWKEVTASATPIVTGTTLSYTLHFENRGTTPFDVDAVDELADVLDDADLTSGPTVTPASALVAVYVAADENLTVQGTLEVGESATVSYTVTVKSEADRGNNRALNFLLEPGDDIPPLCEPDPEVPTCTDTPLPGSLQWLKVDEGYQPLAGSEWALTPVDEDGAPSGAPVSVTDCVEADAADCTGPDVDPAGGHFRLVGLDYGSYSLSETRAPAGYLLLTTPLPVVVLSTALLDLSGLAGFPDLINFMQTVPTLPLTGGVGEDAFLIGGALSALVLLGLLLGRYLRRRTAGAARGAPRHSL